MIETLKVLENNFGGPNSMRRRGSPLRGTAVLAKFVLKNVHLSKMTKVGSEISALLIFLVTKYSQLCFLYSRKCTLSRLWILPSRKHKLIYIQPIPLGMTFSKAVSKFKTQSSNVSFATFQCKETFEL